MGKLTAEEFNLLSKEEKSKQYMDLADGEMTRYRLLYDIPVPQPVNNDKDLTIKRTDKEIRESAESLIKMIKYFEPYGTLSKEDEKIIREEAEKRIKNKEISNKYNERYN